VKLVVAFGGNALLRRSEPPDAEHQLRNVAIAVGDLVAMAGHHQLVVTHGNGPQVGLLALQAAAYSEVAPYPLDMLGAESEGLIGYVLEQALESRLPDQKIATLLTQVEVAGDDPAFSKPTKPIGPIYDFQEAERLRRERGWSFVRDTTGLRRVVASPTPLRIRELAVIQLLIDAGVMVICAGGGGIPVVIDANGWVTGVEAVIDKDLSAALLAEQVGADGLLLLTDVDGVYDHWGSPGSRRLVSAPPAAISRLGLPPGSMGPKAEAASRFASNTGHCAYIGGLGHGMEILAGQTGTRIDRSEVAAVWSTCAS
jgi:carbamate kinase